MAMFDPRTRNNKELDKDIERGKMDSYKRSAVGGIYTYQTASKGETIIKDIEPADNQKKHQ